MERGAKRRGLTFDELEVGDAFRTPARTVTEADVVGFAGLSGDFNPLHTDAEEMKSHPFGQRIAHGLLGVAMGTGLAARTGIFEGTTFALLEQRFRYARPVFFGDTIRVALEVLEKATTRAADRGVVTFRFDVLNQRDETAIEGVMKCMMLRERHG